MVLTVANDSGAFVVGRQFGKRPLNRLLSPSKTIEGTAGGTILTLVAGALLLPIMSVWTRKAAWKRPSRFRSWCRSATSSNRW